MINNSIEAFIFDLDGTLVDSGLDFDQMRLDLGFPTGEPVLEQLELIEDQSELDWANTIIHKHELEGALNSTIYEGVAELLEYLKKSNKKIGLLTRNSTKVTEITLKKFNLKHYFDIIYTRDNCVAKPDPRGLLLMLEKWEITADRALYFGDFKLDLDTAKNAKIKSVLYLNSKNSSFAKEANYAISSYSELLNDFSLDK